MAHFAQIDQNNIVVRVVVVADEHEADGENWCAQFFGGGTWKQTSYNGNMRYNYAGVGYTFDPAADAYYAPQPYPSWSLDDAYLWQPPIPYPVDGDDYVWDEPTLAWIPG